VGVGVGGGATHKRFEERMIKGPGQAGAEVGEREKYRKIRRIG